MHSSFFFDSVELYIIRDVSTMFVCRLVSGSSIHKNPVNAADLYG